MTVKQTSIILTFSDKNHFSLTTKTKKKNINKFDHITRQNKYMRCYSSCGKEELLRVQYNNNKNP